MEEKKAVEAAAGVDDKAEALKPVEGPAVPGACPPTATRCEVTYGGQQMLGTFVRSEGPFAYVALDADSGQLQPVSRFHKSSVRVGDANEPLAPPLTEIQALQIAAVAHTAETP